MYKFIKLISYLARMSLLPNPFSNLIEDYFISEITNYIFGGIFVLLSYKMTGAWYSGKEKFIGSLGYLVNYTILTFLFLLITRFIIDIYLALLIFSIIYVIMFIIEFILFG